MTPSVFSLFSNNLSCPLRNSVPLLLLISLLSFNANSQDALSDTSSAANKETPSHRCDHFDPLRKPMFGDLHVHTKYSFDSYISSQRNDPWDAYRYAKGEPITLSNESAEQTLIAQISRPLDFTAVTDHAEFLGEINVCTEDSSSFAYWWPHCIMTRSDIFIVQLLAADWWQKIGVSGSDTIKKRSFLCNLPGVDCKGKLAEYWRNIQQAADDHQDKSSACKFTTFVGYEYTDAPDMKNLHRNVIFRNEHVTELPISTYDTGTHNFPELWVRLREQCINASNTDNSTNNKGCDVMAIPHNSNLSGGLMFADPKNEREAQDRLFFEPVVELTQHKASSECRFDRLAGRGVNTTDELCTFEQNKTDNLASLGVVGGEMQTEVGAPVSIDEFADRNMLRNVLKAGLELGKKTGTNPFKMGFIGSTDTHSATPGGTEESPFVGHLGRRDAGYRNVQDHWEDNPGGLAVVWAEENSRDAIFDGLRRKESYATSGTRPIVRFFGGWDYTANMCNSVDMVAQAYQRGVAMGGDLKPKPFSDVTKNNLNTTHSAPTFLVAAMKDSGTTENPGNDLQRLQIIKGWTDSQGVSYEKVFDVAGNAHNGATVNPQTCEPQGVGYTDLCTVWQDPEFDQNNPAFYYVRVLENPSCRWSTLQCQAAGVNPFSKDCKQQAQAAQEVVEEKFDVMGNVYNRCCLKEADEPFYSPTLQERAWTSPIWYSPST